MIADEPSAQEAASRVTRASVKKVPVTRSLKRSKKSQETDVALEAHGSAASFDDVSKLPLTYFLCIVCVLTHASFSRL
jgi:hypothetical protein